MPRELSSGKERRAIQILKKDLFGEVRRERQTVHRDTRTAAWPVAWLARRLARREADALAHLAHLAPRVAQVLHWDGQVLQRSWMPGRPMQEAQPRDTAYFRDALTLLRQVHRAGVVHNDAAKEPNWLVLEDGTPALLDFQLAGTYHRRTRMFRVLAREDLRHLLKHKRTYCPEALSSRQKAILAQPSLPSRLWMATGKRIYLWITRGLLNWQDREGAGDRYSGN